MNKFSYSAAVLLLVGFFCALLYGQIFVFDYALYFRDIYHNYAPFLNFIAKTFAQGHLPLWNPLVFGGTPQLASLEPPVFYPPGWIFCLGLRFSWALALNLIFHHLLAAAGIYLLGRSYGWRWFSCALCACLFTFSGMMVSMNNFHPLQNTVAWLPLMFWAAHELLSRPRSGAMAAFAGVFGLQILSGHLEVVYFECLLLLIYGLFELKDLPTPRWRGLGLLGIAVVLGLGLSAIQLLPALAYLPETVRRAGVGSAAQAEVWSFHPFLSLMLMIPEQSGNVFKEASLNTIFGEPEFGYSLFFLSVYTGVLSWILAFGGLRWLPRFSPRRRYVYFAGCFVLCLLLAFGKYTPLYGWLLALPGTGFFRYPSKLLIFASFGLIMAAGFGLEQVLEEPRKARQLIGVAAALSSLAMVCWTLLTLSGERFLDLFQALLHSWRPDVSLANCRLWAGFFRHFFGLQLLNFVLLAALFGGLWLIYLRQPRHARLTLGLLLFAANLDLLASGVNSLWMSDRKMFETPSPLAVELMRRGLDRQPQERMIMANVTTAIPDAFAPNLASMVNFRASYFQPRAMVDNYSVNYGFHNLYGHWPARTYTSNQAYVLYDKAIEAKEPVFRENYEAIGSARYVVTSAPPPELAAAYAQNPHYRKLKSFDDTHVTLWENLRWLPRARFQYQSLVVKSPDLMISAMAHPEATGFDLQHQALILDDQRLSEARRLVPPHEAAHKRWTPPQLIVDQPNRVEISFETNTSGYLVLADQNLPGWEASDNGRATPILLANYQQRAIRVGPGQHRVVFRYQAPGFALGWKLTALAALLWLGLWGLSRRRSVVPSAEALPEPVPHLL